jgi:hypothetical protein
MQKFIVGQRPSHNADVARHRARERWIDPEWWLEFNEVQWGRIMRQISETRQPRLLDAVRMFALANMANIDATVAKASPHAIDSTSSRRRMPLDVSP